MTRPIAALGCLALLTLVGCRDDVPQENLTNIQVPEGDYQSRLMTMAEGPRNAVFIRAIRDAGRDCQGVESSAFQGETSGMPTWIARCDDDNEWLILIARDGVAQVASAAEARQAGLRPNGNSQ